MKVLFVHLASVVTNPEFQVHRIFADQAANLGLQATFVLPEQLRDQEEATSPTAHASDRFIPTGPHTDQLGRLPALVDRVPRITAMLRHAWRIHDEVRPDLVYSSQQRLDVFVARSLAARFGTPHVVHLHYHVGPWLGRVTQHYLVHHDHLIAVSESVRASALLRGARPARITTVHNPAPDRAKVNRARARTAMRSSLGLGDTTPVAIAAGRLDPGKGHDDLLEAVARARQEFPDLVLLICGQSSWGTDDQPRLHARAEALGLGGAVKFLGYRKDLPDLLAGADLFCLPSQLEPFGLVYLEAMQAGLPVVAAWSGAVPEIVVHGETGLLSPAHAPYRLAADLIRLLGDAEMRTRMGLAGEKRAREVFDPARLVVPWYQAVTKATGCAGVGGGHGR